MEATEIDRPAAFLAALRDFAGDIRAACRESGWSHASVYRLRARDKAFDDAIDAIKKAPAVPQMPARAARAATAAQAWKPAEPDVTPAPVQDATAELARYVLSTPAYIDGVLFRPGDAITYAGEPGPHMLAVNDAARQAKGMAAGQVNDEAIGAAAYLQQALARRAVLDVAIGADHTLLLNLRGQTFGGTQEERATAMQQIGARQSSLEQKTAERAQLNVGIEQAQAVVDQAAAKDAAELERATLAAITPELDARAKAAAEIDNMLFALGVKIRESVLATGDRCWSRVCLAIGGEAAACCVPNHDDIEKSLIGALLRTGAITLEGIAGLSPSGAMSLRDTPDVSHVVKVQNRLMRTRFES